MSGTSTMKLIGALALSSSVLAGVQAQAQSYPNRPIRMIVPFAPGGGTDIVARAIGQRLSEAVGQPVVIENKAGANGNIGMELAAKATPDGYTISFTSSALVINPALYKKIAYDPVRDFSPVTLATLIPFILVVHPSLPVGTVRELISYASSRKGQLSYASSGTGNATHLSMALFETMAKIDMVHVPYKGTGLGIIDVIAGHVQLMFGSIPSTMPQVRAGKLKLLAVSSARRSAVLPDTPTVAEAGLPKYELTSWYAALTPAGTPPLIVTRLNSEIVKILRVPEVKARLTEEGAEPVGNSPGQFASFIRAEMVKYAEVVQAARITPEK